MNKKNHKKKQKKKGKGEGRNKENIIEDVPDIDDVPAEEQEKEKPCYEVKHSDVMGRYLVAARDIQPGEIIIEEPAIAVGPCSGCGLICLGCYRELDETSLFKCRGCKWPLCSTSCPGQNKYTGHSKLECDALKLNPPDYTKLDDLRDSYQALMPLSCRGFYDEVVDELLKEICHSLFEKKQSNKIAKWSEMSRELGSRSKNLLGVIYDENNKRGKCLLLKKSDPSKWAALSAMESHNEVRRARGDIWPINERLVVQRLKKWRMEYDDEEIHTICGILEVNAFEVGGSGASARALYDRAYLLAHDCTPSTTHTDAEAQPARPLVIRAAVRHAHGQLMSACYAYTLQGTLKRREHINHSKFFDCCCARCADPSELGTFASAFRCPRCAGRVLPRAPLDAQALWACVDGCQYTMPAAAVQMLLKRLTDEFEQIDANDVAAFEGFLHKYRNVIQSGHYLCLSAKHSLSQLYGKVPDYMIHEMPDHQLNRKIEICRDLMKVFDVVEPGYSRLRGVTLYELHAPLMILTTRDFEKKAISKENLRTRLKEIVNYLTEASLILGFEPRQSSEGLMASAAREALKKIKTWEQIIGKIS